MSKHFTHLHLHTEYSLLDGAIRLPDLVNFAKEQQWKAIGISDHGNIFGAVKFFQIANKAGVKPILGTELYLTTDVKIRDSKEKYFHIILIVQNAIGYKNLCRLMAFAYQEGFYFKPRVDYQTLAKYSEGLIATTACVGGHIPTLLRQGEFDEAKLRTDWFLNTFSQDRFFFELAPATFDKQVETNKLLLDYSAAWGVKCIGTSDAHYLHADDHEAHEVLLSVQTKDQLSNPDRFSFGECRVFVRTTEEMLSAFPGNEKLIWNTGDIADSCDFNFDFGKLFFPQCPVPAQHTQESYFEALCLEGLETLKNQDLIPQEKYADYDSRLRLEIDLIVKMGFVGYFLVVSDFIKWAKRQNIPVGPGRGSAAGSLVAWSLEITNVDPLRYNLLFERFLNPERVSMPDIDIDFCIERREDVINYVKDKYGHDCVCQIITFGTMMAKGVIKDVARVLGFPFQDANAITDLIPEQLKITLQESIEQEPRLQELIDNNPKVKKLFDICFKLEGLTRHASKHAAGVVISPEPLAQSMPLYTPAKSNDLIAQYAMTELEAIGFLKMDFLGLKNLTVIDRALKAIEKNHGIKINLDKLPFDDSKTFALLGRGETNAIFQFESDGLKEVLRKLQPDKFEDLIAVNALYRPGPLGAGMVDDFIERRHGRQKVIYMFPELEPILSETYGVIVYQEQVMKIASAIAGYSLGAADILRRAMGKKKADVMAEQKEEFVAGAKTLNFDLKKAGELFDVMAHFAGYGFNKSHSAAYALIAYHTAYLKAHYPREFMAASLSFETSNPDQLTHYLQEVSDMGIKTISPDINLSNIAFTALPDGILFGLQGIKNVGLAALEDIIEQRASKPFFDLLDFCKRVDLRTVNKRVIESLICAGAMDKLPGSRAQKINELEKIIDIAHAHKEAEKTGQMDLFGMAPSTQQEQASAEPQPYLFQLIPDWSDKEKLEKEKEVAGFYLSSHPLKSYPAIKFLNLDSFSSCLEKIKTVTSIKEPFTICAGLLQQQKAITTKKGDRMAFAQFEDLSGHAEVIIFPSLYAKVEHYLSDYNVFLIKGAIDITSQQKCKIKANSLIPIDLLFEADAGMTNLQLQLPTHMKEDLLAQIKEALTPGSLGLQLLFHENNEQLVLSANQKISCSLDLLTTLQQLDVQAKISF
jgi:DNA polymerase-3 subunit alpha